MVNPERKIVLADGMIGQITIPLPADPKRWWKNARGRVNPEGLVVGGVVSNVAWVTMWPTQTALSPIIHEVPWDRPDLVSLRVAAIALSGIAASRSVALERRAFKEKKYSVSPPGTILNVATGKPLLASIGEHVFDHVLLSSANPFFQAGLVHNDPGLMVDSIIATSLSLSAWNLFWNRLIVNGNVDPAVRKISLVTNKVSQIKDSVWNKIKGGKRDEAKNPAIMPGENIAVEPDFLETSGDLDPGKWVNLPPRNDDN